MAANDYTPTAIVNTDSLVIQDFKFNLQMTESICNDGNTAITTVAASANSFGTVCYNYGTGVSATFVPPSITSPSSCSDAVWNYYLSSIPTPTSTSNLMVYVDSINSLVKWERRFGSTEGYDASHDYGTYSFTFNAAL